MAREEVVMGKYAAGLGNVAMWGLACEYGSFEGSRLGEPREDKMQINWIIRARV